MKGCKAAHMALLALGLAVGASASAQVNLRSGETYTQDFNTLPSTGTSNAVTTLPAGWIFVETGTGANTTFRAVDGSSNAGDTLSLGAATGGTTGERALGSLRSGSVASVFGARLRNDNPGPLVDFTVSYVGEQWRHGAANRCDFLRFEYSTDATSLSTGTWTAVPELDFQSLACGAVVTNALNGNSAENQRFLLRTINSPNVAAGAEFWIRWTDTDATSSDDSLAIDDVAITVTAGPAPAPVVSFAAAAISANEGGLGQSNPVDFTINLTPAPTASQSVSFNVAVTGEAGRFSYTGPSTLTVTSATVLPIVLSATSVGNNLVQGDSVVTMTLSGFTGTDVSQTSPITKQATILEDDLPALPVVSFAEGVVSVAEGDSASGNLLTFNLNLSAPPAAGTPVSFDLAVTGPGGRFDYAGPSTVQITDQTPLPYAINVRSIGNRTDEPDAVVSISLSNFVGTDGTQATPLSKSGTILDDDLPISEVFTIQGSGACSPFITACNAAANVTGDAVRSRSNIVTAVGTSGFTMQTPNARDDNNSLTSNGVYVFTAGAPRNDAGELIAVGDQVEVIGRVAEFFSLTQIVVNATRDTGNSILTEASAQPLPSAVAFGNVPAGGSIPIPSKDPANLSCGAVGNFECFEGMRIQIATGAVTVSNQRFASPAGQLFAEVWISPYGERGLREKGARFGNTLVPSNSAAGVWDGNPEIFEMDADFLLTGLVDTELAGGTRFSAEGVIGFDFGDYEFWPSSLTIVAGSNQVVSPVPAPSTRELTIGSFNAFRFCDAVAGNSPSLCAATAALETNAARVTHQLGQVSAYLRDVLRSPDVVGLQEVENLAILQQLATQISADGGPAYVAYLVEGSDVGGIDVGYLVNPARVTVDTVTQLAATETWNDPSGTPTSILHDRPPLLLRATFIGNGRPFAFNVINNHTRSRGGVDVSDAEGERVRAKRFLQARSIATLVQGLQSDPATAQVPLFVIGDHNAYQFTDGYADVVGLIAGTYRNDENTCAPANSVTDCELPGGANIVSPAMINAVDLLPAEQRYSYKFTENFGAVQGSTGRDVATNQVLDHGLFNSVASNFVTGMAYGRANVDASTQRFRVCNFTNRDLALCPQGTAVTPAQPWVPTGSSDHDGFVIFVSPPLPAAIFANGFEAIN
ncbi:MAG: hypothetical protein H4O13_02225 [Xanthomonadales bacterium]|nr:hypothetical protein [Xanthomonadales bacterium]